MTVRPPRAEANRDQLESGFTSILEALVRAIPGARAAALVDNEGETVDYAGGAEPFAIRVAAAHGRILLDDVRARGALRDARWLVVRAERASYLVHELPDELALVVQLGRRAGFASWRRAVAVCGRSLGAEAGWSWKGASWFAVDVTSDRRTRRPLTVQTPAGVRPIEVLGAIVGGLSRGEKGWRVRFPSGVETTLIREASGRWYADEPTERPGSRPGSGRKRGPEKSL